MKSADSAGGWSRQPAAGSRSQYCECLLPVQNCLMRNARRRLSYWIVIVTNEARRFIARPSGVALSAFGRSSP